MGRYTGAFHVHSTFSDGELGLEQIAGLARAQKLDFVVCADHAPYLDAGQIAAMVRECAALSVDGLLMMPGLEFELEGRHVVALGSGELLGALDAATVVKHPEDVRARGGFTVWAHPALTFAWSLRRPMHLEYDAWEIWNRRADGASPSLPLILGLRRARRGGRQLRALAGTDFHKGTTIAGPFVTLEGLSELTLPAVLEALRQGQYRIEGTIGADGVADEFGLLSRLTSVVRYGLQRARCVLAFARYRCLAAVGLK